MYRGWVKISYTFNYNLHGLEEFETMRIIIIIIIIIITGDN
jgi:hypothetical protein